MIVLLLFAIGLLIFSLVTLSPSSAIVRVGYGDIGSFTGEDLSEMRTAAGYRDGSWAMMLTFPFFAMILGIMHNFIAVKLCKRRGEGSAKVFVASSIAIVIATFVVLIRLLGEN